MLAEVFSMKVRPNVWKAAVIVLVAPWQSAYGATGQITAADFRFQIRPILSKNCFSCQGPDEGHRQAKLRLDEREVAIELGAMFPALPMKAN